jgi:hypothetical protein
VSLQKKKKKKELCNNTYNCTPKKKKLCISSHMITTSLLKLEGGCLAKA